MAKLQKALLIVGLVFGLFDLFVFSNWLAVYSRLALLPGGVSLIVNGILSIPYSPYFIIMLIGGIFLELVSIPFLFFVSILPFFLIISFILTIVNISVDKPNIPLAIIDFMFTLMTMIVAILSLHIFSVFSAFFILVGSIFGLVASILSIVKRAKEKRGAKK